MLIENNTLMQMDIEDIIDGVFTAPEDVLYVGTNLYCYKDVVKMVLPNVVEIGNYFLLNNTTLESLIIPKVEKIGGDFLFLNSNIEYIYICRVLKKYMDYFYSPILNLVIQFQ